MGLNKQPIQKQELDVHGLLNLHHLFHSIQGEGPYVGMPAVFVRLHGCNLQCPHCDEDYTSLSSRLTPKDILIQLEERFPKVQLVVITGGEPFRQNITPFAKLLLSKGYIVQVETNGSLHVEGFPYHEVTVVCSPKTGRVNAKLLKHISAYKYVIAAGNVDPEDGLPIRALDHPVKDKVARPVHVDKSQIYVQPEDSKEEKLNKANIKACLDSCFRFGYRLCLQTHKYLNLE